MITYFFILFLENAPFWQNFQNFHFFGKILPKIFNICEFKPKMKKNVLFVSTNIEIQTKTIKKFDLAPKFVKI